MVNRLLSLFILLSGMSSFAQSKVEAKVYLSPLGSFRAETLQVKGFAESVHNGVQVKNILVELRGIKTGSELRDKHLQEKLETSKYPRAELTIGSGSDGKGQGTIKIRDKTIEIQGEYEVQEGYVTARFPLSIKEIGIAEIKYLGIKVKDRVDVTVTIPLKK